MNGVLFHTTGGISDLATVALRALKRLRVRGLGASGMVGGLRWTQAAGPRVACRPQEAAGLQAPP